MSIKNRIKEGLSNAKCKTVIAIRICKRITIQNFQKGKIKSRRAFKKLNCNIEKAKRFLSKKAKIICISIGKATKLAVKWIRFVILKLSAKTKQFIKKVINKCKVRLIIRKFKVRNKRAYKIKLLEAAKETKTEKVDNSLIFVNNGMILYKTSILSYIIKYLKIVKVAIEKMIVDYSCNPSDLIVCISPSIRKCHFEVDEDVKEECEKIFADTGLLEEIIECIGEKEGKTKYVIDTVLINRIVLNKLGVNRPNLLDKVFCNSKMLSADVDAALDPIYASVSERNNASFLGHGIGLNKYTGARGKSGASDANAEYVAEIRAMLESNNIPYQIGELGKVDVGGGGTIAYILANKGIDVIDCGVPVLSMHSPYEVTSKFDIYQAYRTYESFMK